MYDRRRQNLDRHAAYILVAFVAGRWARPSSGGCAIDPAGDFRTNVSSAPSAARPQPILALCHVFRH
jgi:hypothetical protein